MSTTRNVFAFVLILASTLNLLLVILRVARPSGTSDIHTWRGHDYPEFLPLHTTEPELVHLRVEESNAYPLLGNDSDTNWFSLTSAGWGYTHLGPEDRTFMVTIFHEMHCMRMLNFALGDSASTEHVHHCLNYLRQATLCSLDLTLEPGDFATRNFETDRVGALHTCRDWSAAYDIMEERWDDWLRRKGLA
ncbi:hypothetical protein FPV67DRAFT_1680554 [Lyophyllum atratum]|nr:hypothetical protein FPV67DRAFT_1680554 [Lyophyllum atratum]